MQYTNKEKPATGDDGHCKDSTAKFNKTYSLYQDRIDFDGLKRDLRPYIFQVLHYLGLNGKYQGNEYTALNPTRPDTNLGSFKINIHTGKWADYATGDKGGDIISYWAYGMSQIEAAKELKSIVRGL